MEIITGIGVIGIVLYIISFFKFSNRMSAIEIEDFAIFSENDTVVYRDYLMLRVIEDYPNLSDKAKVKIVIEVLRNAFRKGGQVDHLKGPSKTYTYVFLSYIERIKEIEKGLENDNSLDMTIRNHFLKAI